MFDIDSQVSLEGNISDFQFEVIKSKQQVSTNAASLEDCADMRKNMSSLKKGKINKLKERLKDMQKSQQFVQHKLEHYVSSYEQKLASISQINERLKTELVELKKEKKEFDHDLSTITNFIHSNKGRKPTSKSPQIKGNNSSAKSNKIKRSPSDKKLKFEAISPSPAQRSNEPSPRSHERKNISGNSDKNFNSSGGLVVKKKKSSQKCKPFTF